MIRFISCAVIVSAFFWGCSQDGPPPDPQAGAGATLFIAAQIITLDPDRSGANAVLVKDRRITDVGKARALQRRYPAAMVQSQFEDDVIIPGLIDPHVHITLGAILYAQHKAAPWDIPIPGGVAPGAPDRAAFLERVKDIIAESPGDGLVVIWGYHNLIHGELTRHDIDALEARRPVAIWHYSGHDWYFNSVAIAEAGFTPAMAEKFHGVDLDAQGELTGRIYEDAVFAALSYLGPTLLSPEGLARGHAQFEDLLDAAGVTSVAEMGYGIFGLEFEDRLIVAQYDKGDGYRLFLVPEHRAFDRAFGAGSAENVRGRVNPDAAPGTPRVLAQVKFFTDGAYYSQTMKLRAPGYIGGQSAGTDGLWVTPPDALSATLLPYWQAGLDLHIHSNGDAGQDATIAARKALPSSESGTAPRTIIEHGGLIRPEHIKEMSGLNMGLSAASHYVMYMGHDYQEAIGDRVKYITPLASAAQADVPVALHSDAPLAPPHPLLAAGTHMTRATRQGGVSTPSERLSAEQALKSITWDAAWMLGLEQEIGSIEIGKRADFTVLAQNPLGLPAEQWGQIKVQARIVDGRVFPAMPIGKTD